MKGISHFASGLCLATFVPGVVEEAAKGSLLIALGGACALLPDTLDFKLAKFLEKRDADILPDRDQPDAQHIADQLAHQIRVVQQEGRPRVVQLHPLRLTVAEWVLYTVRFDVARGDVVVSLDRDGADRRAHVGKLDYTYDGPLHIEELGGPSLKLVPSPNGVRIEFLPWHRTWSHSLVIALALGLILGVLLEPRAGLVAALGYAVHILEDQLGFMGSNLFAPLSRGRTDGLKLLHSGDTIPNLVTVWLSLTLILFNLDRAQAMPLLSAGPYLAFVVLLPSALLIALYVRRQYRKHVERLERQRQRDLVAESEEVQA
ncbi:MAG: metal-dependent hydrolase [Anaerolineae bacterium]|nr:metal-dependent hydrolase [Thermoflexales bacterium]MDW8407103.1 metal-dependent hydrolase [Anaerolineae bacterium]